MSGSMQDGEMQEMQSSEQAKQLQEMLEQDEEFQQLTEELASQGFNQTDFSYSQKSETAQTATQFENLEGEKVNITANVKNETVTDVKLETDEERSYWWFLLLPAIGALAFLMLRKKTEQVVDEIVPPFDYREKALKMLADAQKLFDAGEFKDAYGRASEALRLYYSYKFDVGKELTATDTLWLLKKHKQPHTNAQKCLNLCGLVEFAKYQPNKRDFNAIINLARKEIV